MKKNIKIYEMPLLHLTILMLFFGAVMLYSASSTIAINKFGWDKYAFYFNKHIVRILIGFIALLIMYSINLKWLQRYSKHLLILSWILMLYAYFTASIYDLPTRRSFLINGKNLFTTSDFARFALIVFTANFIDKNKKEITDLKKILIEYIPYFSITMILIIRQPDYSSTFIISLIVISMLIVSGLQVKFVGYLSIIGSLIAIFAYNTHNYVRVRVNNWWFYDPIENPTEQMSRSLQALHNGGLFGQGFGKSLIKEGFMAEGHTDYILALIAEEMGFFVILSLFIAFFVFYFITINISKSSPNIFCSMLCLGIAYNILYYFLINSAYVVGILPPTGLAIPFISYGGSHTLFTLIAIGTVLNISKYSNIYKKRYL